MPNLASSTDIGASKQTFDGGDNGEHNSVGLKEISKMFVRPDKYFYRKALFDRVHSLLQSLTSS